MCMTHAVLWHSRQSRILSGLRKQAPRGGTTLACQPGSQAKPVGPLGEESCFPGGVRRARPHPVVQGHVAEPLCLQSGSWPLQTAFAWVPVISGWESRPLDVCGASKRILLRKTGTLGSGVTWWLALH